MNNSDSDSVEELTWNQDLDADWKPDSEPRRPPPAQARPGTDAAWLDLLATAVPPAGLAAVYKRPSPLHAFLGLGVGLRANNWTRLLLQNTSTQPRVSGILLVY